MVIKVYISKHCKPCQEIKDLIKQGKYEDEIQVIDIETDKGFGDFSREVLEYGDAAIPSAYKEGIKCKILIDEEEGLIFNCPSRQDNQQLQGQNKDNSA